MPAVGRLWPSDDDDDDDECHDRDDLACFECATVSDETSLDLPQKGHFI